jgi:flagellar biosynthesis/type III secretory pathway protein FliH
MALPQGAWERSVAVPLLVHFGIELPDGGAADEEEDVIVEIREWFEGYQAEQRKLREEALKLGLDQGLDEGKKLGLIEGKKLGLDEGKKLGLDEGKKLGLDEGRHRAMARLFEKRLGRAMTGEEHSALDARFDRLGEDRLDEVVLALAGDALTSWLADPEGR